MKIIEKSFFKNKSANACFLYYHCTTFTLMKHAPQPFKYEVGEIVWIYTNEDCYDNFEIEERRVINGWNCYLVDGKYINESFCLPSKNHQLKNIAA